MWLVSAAHAAALRWGQPRRGRPLSEREAWSRIIAGDIELDDPWRFANRGKLTRWSATPPMLDGLLHRSDVIVSGVHASRMYSGLLEPLPDEAQMYVLNESLDADHDDPAHLTRWLAEDRFGAVAIRGVGSHGWGDLCAACTSNEDGTEMRYAPPAAVALDLAISEHPRERDLADIIAGTLR